MFPLWRQFYTRNEALLHIWDKIIAHDSPGRPSKADKHPKPEIGRAKFKPEAGIRLTQTEPILIFPRKLLFCKTIF